MQTKTKTKIKTNTETKIAIALAAAGAVALAAALIAGGRANDISMKLYSKSSELSASSSEAVIAAIEIKAENNDIAISSLPLSFRLDSPDIASLFKNIKLVTEKINCWEQYIYGGKSESYGYARQYGYPNNKTERKFVCLDYNKYGYGQMEEIAGPNNPTVLSSYKGEVIFSFKRPLLIPAGQTRMILVKSDIGSLNNKTTLEADIILNRDFYAERADRTKAKVALQNRYKTVEIIPKKSAALLPDLIVENIRLEKYAGLLGKIRGEKARKVILYVRNIGSGDFSAPLPLAIYRDGKILSGMIVQGAGSVLKSEEVKTYALNLELTQGKNNLRAMVDHTEKIQESNEGNNTFSMLTDENGNAVSGYSPVIAGPDLEVLNVKYYAPEILEPKTGDYAGYEIELRNVGNQEIKGPFKVQAYLNGEKLRDETFGSDFSLASGNRYTYRQHSYVKFSKSGENKIALAADSENAVKELDENNNKLEISINVKPSALSCVDSDGGDNFFLKGYRIDNDLAYWDAGVKNWDFCILNPNLSSLGDVISDRAKEVNKCSGSKCYVVEQHCAKDLLSAHVGVKCKKGCKDGACLK